MAFDPTNEDHKAQLYRAIVACAKQANMPFDIFFQQPFDPPWSLSSQSRRNLQHGVYSRIRATVLYDFLLEHHFTEAHRAAPDIFPHTPEMRWQQIVDERAATEGLNIKLFKSGMGIVQRADQLTNADVTFKLGQQFYFELTSPNDAYAIALQGLRVLTQ